MKDYILVMHEHAYKHLNDGISFDEMKVFLESKGYDLQGVLLEAVDKAYGDVFLSPVDYQQRASHFRHQNSHVKYTMASDAYFRYLDYLEYKAANRSSKQAQQNANTAIRYAQYALVITILVGVAQIIFS